MFGFEKSQYLFCLLLQVNQLIEEYPPDIEIYWNISSSPLVINRVQELLKLFLALVLVLVGFFELGQSELSVRSQSI